MKTVFFVCVCVAVFATWTFAIDKEKECNKKSNCDDCLEGVSTKNDTEDITFDCYWCSKPSNKSGHKCRHLTFNSAIPVDDVECENLQLNVATCRLNAMAIVIMITLGCFLFLVAVCCVCCCCCYFCAKRRHKSRMIEEERYLDEKEGIRQRSADRRAERKAKSDEIKKKYGLNTDEGAGTYKRLE